MKLRELRNWFLSLASASALTQMVFAQATIPGLASGRSEQVILVQDKAAAPAADKAAAAPAAAPVYEAASNGNGNGGGSSDEGPWRALPQDGKWKIYGFIYGTANQSLTNNNGTRYNGPMTMNEQEGFYLNQLYLTIEKPMEEEFSIGGRADVFYGNDYNASQSRGWELRPRAGVVNRLNTGQDYGIVNPQLYAEVGTSKASLMVGHFWTPIGYTVVPATGNFFNTMPYGFMAGQPFTHWGAMAKFTPNENWYGYFSVVNGWDALDRPTDRPGWMGGIKYTACEKKWYAAFNMISGDEPGNLIFPNYDNRTLLNFIFQANLSDRLEFVFENTTGIQSNNGLETSTYYSFLPHLFYKINDCWRAGLRYEYFHDAGGFAAGIRDGNPNVGPYNGNFQSIATGLNWTPNGSKNLSIRPEIRYDWFNGNGVPFNAGRDTDQLFFVLGGVFQF